MVFTSFMYKAADAQVRINVNINSQPEWGPSGYQQAEYYYLPDIDVYYHIAGRTYTYYEGKQWITRQVLPARYHHYDLYSGYKVVINDNRPWARHNDNRRNYAQYRGRHNQETIRDERGRHYTGRNTKENGRPGVKQNGRDQKNQNSRPQRRS